MTGFEYASGLISIIVGLAIARVLGGIGALLNADHRTPRDWIVGAWCVVLFLALVAWWMIGWTMLRPQIDISFGTLIFWTSATALLYLAGYLLVPGTIASHTGSRVTNFDLPSAAFFACLAAHFGMMFVYANIGSETGFDLGVASVVLLTIGSAAGVALKTVRGYTIHLAIWVGMLVAAAVIFIPSIG